MVRNCAPPRMEATFYHDDQSYHANVNQLKRTMTLDLNQAKRQKFNPSLTGAPVLSSPDISMCKLGSPELEKLIIQNGMVTTATPTPTMQILFPRTVTEEQASYVRGFEEALNELHNSDSSQGGLQQVDVSGNAITYTNLDQQQHSTFSMHQIGAGTGGCLDNIIVKDEPQTVPSMGSSPPVSPIDMETQERIKLERKRQRNRVAASKCRRRKLERISKLEDKVKMLKGENSELSSLVNKLKEHVCHLKEQVMDHVHSGCEIDMTNQF